MASSDDNPFATIAPGSTSAGPQAATATATGYTPSQASSQGYDAAQMTSKGYDAATATAGQADTFTRDVKGNETVQGQIENLLAQNSPLLQRARSQAAEQAASRGLLNSTMGVQAGETAVLNTALPIAQQDASTYLTTSRDNQAVQNQASQFNAGQRTQVSQTNAGLINNAQAFTAQAANDASKNNMDATNTARQFTSQAGNTASLQNAQMSNTASQFGANANNQASQFNASQINDLTKLGISNEHQTELAQLNNQAQLNQQTVSSNNGMFQQVTSQISAIMQNPNMTPDAKQQAVNNLVQQLRNSMTVNDAVASTPAATLLDWGPTQSANQVSAPAATTPGGAPAQATQPEGQPTGLQPGQQPDGSYVSPDGRQWSSYFAYQQAMTNAPAANVG